jgi:tetratricopeptide (TPR) repeat protein
MYILCLLFSIVVYSQQNQNSDFAEYAKQFQKQQQNKQTPQSNLPKKDISKHVSCIAVPDGTAAIKLSVACLSKAKKSLTQTQLHDLDELQKEFKNDSVIVNEAMVLYSAGVKTDAVIYLITSVIVTSPDPWFFNNLGVILKDDDDYENALQCFLYTDKNIKSSAIVKTNLGWTSAYYGDFEAAKKYFNDALKLSPQHDGALEGLCNIAYVEGNFSSLMDFLLRRIKLSGGGGGNINQLVAPGLIDDILDAYENNSGLKKSDPLQNHLFDNADPVDNTYNPGGANDIMPKLPTITAYFSYDAFGMNENMDAIRSLKNEIISDEYKDAEKLKSEFNSLPPWKKQPYTDEHGDWIYPYNYETEYKMFERITIEFNKRDIWLAKSMIKDEIEFDKTSMVGNQLGKMLKACAGKADEEACICQWAKPNLGVVNNELSGYFSFWSKLYKQWLENVNWYIAASSAYIKKVHHPQLNAYLNHKREAVVRNYILGKYSTWLDDCLRVGGAVDMLKITKECANNPPKTSIAAGDDVITPPLKKLKSWPEKCVVPTGDFDYDDAPAGIIMTCDELKLRFGAKKKIAGASASAALHIDFKFGEKEKQDEVKIYLQAALKAGVSKNVSIDNKNIGEIGAEGALKGTAFIQFKGDKMNYGVEGTSEVGASAGAKSEEDNMTKKETDIAKQIDKYLPGAEAKASGSILWTAETGAKVKVNGVKTSTSNIPDMN